MDKSSLIIAAGGVGKRAGLDMPKQFYEILSKPVIVHTIEAFENIREIEEIIISCHKDYVLYTYDIIKAFGLKKVKTVVSGGDTRQESVYKALSHVSDDSRYVLIHDAARPLISESAVLKCMENACVTGCSAVGRRVTDTLKRTDNASMITETVSRENLWQIQTPQIFKRDIIFDCHNKAKDDGFIATDDCMLCEKYGYDIIITEADCNNIKITERSDIALAEALLNV